MINQNLLPLVCILFILSICSTASLPASDIWESLGPEGGAISAIACAKTDTQIVYAAAGDGVYKSTNSGKSWQRRCVGLSGPSTYTSLAVDGDTVYVGTSDGVYKSVDAAETWEPCSEGLMDVTCLAIAPTEPKVIYAAAGIDQSRIFKSTDRGENWFGIDESFGPGRFYSIAVHS